MPMSSSRRLLGGGLAGALVLAIAFFAFAQGLAPRTVRDGVFSAAQVERGRATFDNVCSDCHDLEEFTGPGAYLDDMEGDTVWDVFDYVWSNMPEDFPSSLEPEEYADVLSYVFSAYGLPAGDADLPTEREPLDAIAIAAPGS